MVILSLYYVTTLLFLLGQLGRVSFLNQHINMYFYEIPFILLLLCLCIKYKFEPLRYFAKVTIPLGFFSLFMLFGLQQNSHLYLPLENGIALLYNLRLLTYLFSIPYVTYYFMAEIRSLKHLKKGILIIIMLIIASAFFQYTFYPNLRNLLYLGWDPHLYRVFGVFFEPYLAATAFGMIFYYLLELHSSRKVFTYLKYVLIFLSLILLALTFSRTAYLAFAFVTLFYLCLRKRWLYMGLFLVLFAGVIIIIPKPEGVGINLLRTFSVFTRVENTKQGIEMWRKDPYFGVGYNRVGFARIENKTNINTEASHAGSSYHSSFITILASTGWIGLLLFIVILHSLSSFSILSRIIVIFISLISFGDNALLHPFILFLLMQFIAASYINHPLRK